MQQHRRIGGSLVLVALATGCSAAPASTASPGSTQFTPAASASAPAPRHQTPAGEPIGVPATAAPSATSSAEAAVSAPPFPPQCVGASIELADPRVLDACRVVDVSARPTLPATVALSIEPSSPSLPRGPDGEVVLAIRNATSQPLALDIDLSCGASYTFATQIWDRRFQRRLDQIRRAPCGGGRGCSEHRLLRVQLLEGGSARLPMPVRTRVVDDCTGQRLAALPPGPYGLRIKTPMGIRHDARLTLQ